MTCIHHHQNSPCQIFPQHADWTMQQLGSNWIVSANDVTLLRTSTIFLLFLFTAVVLFHVWEANIITSIPATDAGWHGMWSVVFKLRSHHTGSVKQTLRSHEATMYLDSMNNSNESV